MFAVILCKGLLSDLIYIALGTSTIALSTIILSKSTRWLFHWTIVHNKIKINVNSLLSLPVDRFLKNLSRAGKDTSRSSSFIHLKVASGSKKDRCRKVTP